MSKNKNAQRFLVTGCSGFGKSWHIKNCLKAIDRCVVFDVLGEYSSLTGFKKALTLNESLNIIKTDWKKGFKISYLPPSGSEQAALHHLSNLLLEIQKPYYNNKSLTELHLIVEEMNICFGTNIKENYTGFAEVCSRGRHSGINVIGAAQRAAEINTRFRGNCNYKVYFYPADATDFQTIGREVGTKYKDELSNLKVGEYLKFERGQVQKLSNKP